MTVRAQPRTDAGRALLRLYEAGLAAARPELIVPEHLRRTGDVLWVQDLPIDLSRFHRRRVVALGKAARGMARAAAEVLVPTEGGLIITNDGGGSLEGFEVLTGTHPVPDERSFLAGSRLAQLADGADDGDFVLFCLSGGASALAELPRAPLTPDDLVSLNRALLASGLPIAGMNRLRKRASALKGGGLAKRFEPATVVVLVISDVLGVDVGAVGSGPLCPDPSPLLTEPEVDAVPWLSVEIRNALLHAPSAFPDRTGAPVHAVVGSIHRAVQAVLGEALEEGFSAVGISDPLVGEAQLAAVDVADLVRKTRSGLAKGERRILVFGGETTVTLGPNPGVGGRCQEFVLRLAAERIPGVCVLAAGTDGIDGPTDAVGALWEAGDDASGAEAALERHDSYPFLSARDRLIRTGPTGTNVNDLTLVWVEG